jgi:hypothetical protein
MYDFDYMSQNNPVTEALLQEQKASMFLEQQGRFNGGSALVAWIRTGDASAEALLETIDQVAGFDEEEELMEEVDEEHYADVASYVLESMEAFGVDFDTSESTLAGSNDAARSAFQTISEKLEELVDSVEECIQQHTMGTGIFEDSAGIHKSKADFRVDRKKRLKRQRRPKKRLSAAQKMALKKNLRKAKRGVAMKMAQKTKSKRSKQGFY